MSLVILLGLFAFCVIIGLPVAFALGIARLPPSGGKVCR